MQQTSSATRNHVLPTQPEPIPQVGKCCFKRSYLYPHSKYSLGKNYSWKLSLALPVSPHPQQRNTSFHKTKAIQCRWVSLTWPCMTRAFASMQTVVLSRGHPVNRVHQIPQALWVLSPHPSKKVLGNSPGAAKWCPCHWAPWDPPHQSSSEAAQGPKAGSGSSHWQVCGASVRRAG